MMAREYSCTEAAGFGESILIRAINSVDRSAIQDGIKRLSEESYYHRFFASKRFFSTTELTQLANPDHVEHVGLIATESTDAGTRTLGIGRYYLAQSHPRVVAELAVVVYDDCQRRGIATSLYKHLTFIAQTLGVEEFYAIVHWSNQPMKSFLAKQGFSRVENPAHSSVEFTRRLDQTAAPRDF